eukprot:341969-Chlamydomonas_euryale.AAC.4
MAAASADAGDDEIEQTLHVAANVCLFRIPPRHPTGHVSGDWRLSDKSGCHSQWAGMQGGGNRQTCRTGQREGDQCMHSCKEAVHRPCTRPCIQKPCVAHALIHAHGCRIRPVHMGGRHASSLLTSMCMGLSQPRVRPCA